MVETEYDTSAKTDGEPHFANTLHLFLEGAKERLIKMVAESEALREAYSEVNRYIGRKHGYAANATAVRIGCVTQIVCSVMINNCVLILSLTSFSIRCVHTLERMQNLNWIPPNSFPLLRNFPKSYKYVELTLALPTHVIKVVSKRVVSAGVLHVISCNYHRPD